MQVLATVKLTQCFITYPMTQMMHPFAECTYLKQQSWLVNSPHDSTTHDGTTHRR